MRSRLTLAVSTLAALVLTVSASAQNFTDQIDRWKMPGWHVRGQTPDTWTINNGVLECTGGGELWGEWIGTTREYTDFAFECDYKMTPTSNSGIYLRTPAEGHPSKVALEIQLIDDSSVRNRFMSPNQFSGAIYKVWAPSAYAAKPVGEWNHISVTADHDRITVVLNGTTVVDVDSRDCPEILNRSRRGAIGLQNHHTPVYFRNIRIADLAAERAAWWREAKFGMFIHWGLYSVLGKGEWNMRESRIPAAEYEKLCAQFNPTGFNAAEWVSLARRAGQKYMVITSKHHDGFAMFDSKVSDYNIVQRTPFGRDPIRELADECRRQGLRFGLYHSIWDWHQPDYEPAPDWDPARKGRRGDFDKYMAYMSAQARELCTNYGPLASWWWDMPIGHEDADGQARFAVVNAMVHRLQPHALINNRAGVPGDFDTPEQYIPPTGLLNPDGSPKQWECCVTLTTGHGSFPPTAWWGYDKYETEYKTPEYCIRMLIDIVSKGGNLLLNVGPMPDGHLQEPEIKVLEAMGEWLDVNGEAIYGTTASPFRYLPFLGRATVKGDKLYVHVFNWPSDGKILLPGLTNGVRSAHLLAPLAASRDSVSSSPNNLAVEHDQAGLIVHLPAKAPDPVASVIALQLDNVPHVEPFTLQAKADGTIALPATFAEIRAKHGQRARFAANGDQVFVTNWTAMNDRVCWQFQVDKAGRYDIAINYAADKNSTGGSYEVAAGQATSDQKTAKQIDDISVGRIFELPAGSATVTANVEATGDAAKFTDHAIGSIELQAGTNLLLIRPIKLPEQGTLMNLRQVTIKPTNVTQSK